MPEKTDASQAYASALREELLISSRYLKASPIRPIAGVIQAASDMSGPWWYLSLDVRSQRSVIRRIATMLVKCLADPVSTLRATQLQLQHKQISSVDQYWTRAVLSKAVAMEVPFPEAIQLATSDALWLARTELEGSSSSYPLELAVIYDSIVLTGAYGVLHAVSRRPDPRTLRAAGQILGHAAMVADRSES